MATDDARLRQHWETATAPHLRMSVLIRAVSAI